MATNYKEVKHDFDIPAGASQDDVADMVRAILSTRSVVRRLVLEITPGEGRQGKILAEMLAPVVGPPDGELLEPDPENLWQMMQRVRLEDVTLKRVKMSVPAVMRSVALVMQAAKGDSSVEAKTPIGWMINEDPSMFLKWLGVKVESAPSIFMNLPLLKVPFVEKDRLVLLCARSRKMDPIHSERGLVLVMEV